MKPIKIFVDCHLFDKGFSGTRTYLLGIYEHFVKDVGFHFYLASNNVEQLESVFGQRDNITYVRYKYHNRILRLLFDTPAIIKKNQINYAHFQYILSPIKTGKYILTAHDVLFMDFPEYFPLLFRLTYKFLYKVGLKKADIKLTVSQYSKERITKHFAHNDVLITPNAVNDVFYENYDKAAINAEVAQKFNLDKYIIYISRWEPRKNHQLVLKAFVDLNLYHDYQLVFIGDQSIENKEYLNQYEPLDKSIKERIITLRKTDFETMLTLLRGADASVYPSIAEGFGIPPLESIASRIPTICSNATAMSDFDFMEDFLFNPNDQEEFNTQLLSILKNDFSAKFEEFAAISKQRYNWKTSANILRDSILNNEKAFDVI